MLMQKWVPLLALLTRSQAVLPPSPTISLPWNTYTASLDKANSIYKFKDVRFGDAPTGSMRFGVPSTPTAKPPPDPKGPIECHGVELLANSEKDNLGIPYPGAPNAGKGTVRQTEDCLFLDIYVPASLLGPGHETLPASAPVIVWFYGGAYVFGAKDGPDKNNPLYTGVGAIVAAKEFKPPQDVIFVSGNYRLGAFGWLAGDYVEKHGTPNAGLYDQRLILSWVQDYINQVRGNKSAVSVWGESAGAGSILHHLVFNEGKEKLNFTKALLLSPGYQFQWDRKGRLNDTYNDFATRVTSCKDGDITCLRKLGIDNQALIDANYASTLSIFGKTGQIAFGPAVDGSTISRLPPNEFAAGHFYRNLESLLISHVDNEGIMFVPKWIETAEDVQKFVYDFFPGSALKPVADRILDRYNYTTADPRTCAGRIIGDSSFVCNSRQLFDAYHGIDVATYMMWYDISLRYGKKTVFEAVHGTDLFPLFHNTEVRYYEFLRKILVKLKPKWSPPERWAAAGIGAAFFSNFSPKYQSYLVSYVLFGDPNKGYFDTTLWPSANVTSDANSVDQVLHVGLNSDTTSKYTLETDSKNTRDICKFWTDIAEQVDPPSSSVFDEYSGSEQEVLEVNPNMEL